MRLNQIACDIVAHSKMRIAVFRPADSARDASLDKIEGVNIETVPLEQKDARASVDLAIGRGEYDAFINGCPAGVREVIPSRLVADALESASVSWGGVRPKHLMYDRGHVKMAMHYEGATVAGYRIVTKANIATAADGLQFPLAFRSMDPADDTFTVCEDTAALDRKMNSVLTIGAGRVLLEEHVVGERKEVVVAGNGDNVEASGDAGLTELCIKLFKAVFEGVGIVSFVFHSADGKDTLVDVRMEVPKDVSARLLVASIVTPKQPTYTVVFHPQMRGYHMRAARDLKKGEVVFEDERHPFPIVTKHHVDTKWSAADQDTFKRYGWPLDSDAHVYAVWENDPRTWRPINHSCDPNLIFGEHHSLNVIAARDIAAGDDLTLDYATFCDHTMDPFDCFCGTGSCRKRIMPDEENLKRYGTNAWHRRLPQK
jgi:hypothetical protein